MPGLDSEPAPRLRFDEEFRDGFVAHAQKFAQTTTPATTTTTYYEKQLKKILTHVRRPKAGLQIDHVIVSIIDNKLSIVIIFL